MLENYFGTDDVTDENKKRLLAVQAALEIAKAAVAAPTSNSSVKSGYDLDNVAKRVADLADAIQDALEP
ncbi:hypothetical protein HA48_10045 [Pantoea wallisii]|uniref:Uncharacterized protein n=1 Tax=Pantoea wallisii TaxID=1076551 RepID=A0A1X1D9L6_9GAMM|nr:hypothetical protein [Pantoea wallisii]ORM73344.1 hypothetical protein HA48_10045 [Pantoea wallisii]